jgi:transposase
MAELCREFGISRKTGYKIADRYQECGIRGLTDRSRRPYRYANQLPFQVEKALSSTREDYAFTVLSGFFTNAACWRTFAATTMCLSLPPTPYST